ncbi:MAG: hypothetical protein EXR75_14475, partial [Myxococcales bacterium]|nr:hypothetical protein [Myxococcales bacterium]
MTHRLALFVVALCTPTPAFASPQHVIGFGARSIAMGGTGVAAAEGADAVYQNPALLSLARHTEFELGLEGAAFSLTLDGPPAAGELGPAPALRATTIGVLVPLPFGGRLRDRLVLGLGFVTPIDVVVRGRILYPEAPQIPLADRVASIAVQGALGLDLGHGVRLGGGFMATAALEGSVLVATDATGRIGTVVEDTLVASYAPLAGATWETEDGSLRVGLAFRGELKGRFNVVIDAENLGDLNIPPLHVAGVAQYDPAIVALEIARAWGPTTLSFGAAYEHWPRYPGPSEATVRCSDAEDDAECAALVPEAPGYAPVVVPRLGVERTLALHRGVDVAVRGGFAFAPSPAPEQRGKTSLYDHHRSILSAGYGLRLAPLAPISFDGFVQLSILHPR